MGMDQTRTSNQLTTTGKKDQDRVLFFFSSTTSAIIAAFSMAGNLNGQYRRPDRSEIGPYLGSSSGGLWVAEKSTAPTISEVEI